MAMVVGTMKPFKRKTASTITTPDDRRCLSHRHAVFFTLVLSILLPSAFTQTFGECTHIDEKVRPKLKSWSMALQNMSSVRPGLRLRAMLDGETQNWLFMGLGRIRPHTLCELSEI